MKFSVREIKDLLKAWIAISVAFAILLRSPSLSFSLSFVIAAITVGAGFLLHELAHKKVALSYNCKAEFKSFDFMLVLAVLMSFFGFLIAAPGAVFIQKYGSSITKKQNGHISAAGPLTNILFAIAFLPLILIFKEGLISVIANYGFLINSWFALFNTIPFGPLDGAKIFRWDKKVGWGMLIISGLLILLRSFI